MYGPTRIPGVSPRASRAALIVILVVAAGRVASTWTVFSQTFDESTHIAAGTEWLERGTYEGEPQHPPLARVAAAVGPYAAGGRLTHDDIGLAEQGNVILHSGAYTRMLSLARAGILPFFLLSIVVVWGHARMLEGELAAVVAALLYSNLPPVLAHAGLATTDMAVTAGIAATLMLLQRVLLVPSRGTAALLGVAAASALTAKFSAVLFLLVAGTVIVLVTRAQARDACGDASAPLLVALAFLVCTWGVYRFHFERLHGGHEYLVRAWVDSKPWLAWLRPHLTAIPLPMPELFSGVAQMLLHNASGHEAYLLGEYRLGGWWYYFPVAIAVKTTIVFLLIVLLSIIVLARRRAWHALAPTLAAIAIVVACMPVNINIGIRHVLPIYPLLAVSGGCAVALLWRGKARAAIVLALAAEVLVSARAHPDYLPYFNAFAGDEPQRILLDSNLDWGQDLLRLEKRARELRIDALRLSYFGTADLERHHLPPLIPVVHDRPLPGWFAVSEAHLGSREHGKNFPWLDRYPMVERVGKSIRLYRIPGATLAAPRAEILAAMARIVVPLPLGTSTGSDGRTWQTRLRLQNRGSAPETVLDRHGNRREVPVGGSVVWDAPSERSAWFLYVRRGAAVTGAVEVSASLQGRLVEGPFTTPAPHEAGFRSFAALRPAAGCDGCARTLRVYCLDSGPVAIDISARAGGRRWSHYEVLANDTGLPAWKELDLGRLLPELGPAPAEVTVVAYKHERVWAMLTVSGARREIVTSE